MKNSQQKGFLVPLLIIIIVVLLVGGGIYVYLQNRYHNQVLESSVGKNQELATSTAPIPGWLTYTDPSGASFQYPPSFNTTYASLDPNVPELIVTDSNYDLDSSGCYIGSVNKDIVNKELQIVINSIPFCLSTGGDVGAGQLYTSYYYTTSHNKLYYTLIYVVHTSNSCSAYMNDPDVNAPDNLKYRECLDTEKNYDSLVMKPIEQSVGTLTFSNRPMTY